MTRYAAAVLPLATNGKDYTQLENEIPQLAIYPRDPMDSPSNADDATSSQVFQPPKIDKLFTLRSTFIPAEWYMPKSVSQTAS